MALNPLGLAPLAIVLGLLAIVVAGAMDERVDRALTQFTRRIFGRYVGEDPERKRRLQSAYVERTYRAYAARTILFTAMAALAGAIVGVYLVTGVLLVLDPILDLLQGLPRTMVNFFGIPREAPTFPETTTVTILGVSGVVGGVVGAGLTYWLRWEIPMGRATERARSIDEGLPRTIAFMYALSRGGVAFPEVVRTLGRNRQVYGTAADEVSVAVREMDLFGRDMITAVRRTTHRTPSEAFKTFGENLASVLQSGRSLSDFLHSQYERHQEEAAARQEEILERLATVAEAYVTLLVAAMLFLFTILLVFGLVLADTLPFLRVLAYVIVPLANAGFVVYLGQKLDALGIARSATSSVLDKYETTTFGKPHGTTTRYLTDGDLAEHEAAGTAPGDGTAPAGMADGGAVLGSGDSTDSVRQGFEQLRTYGRVARFKRALGSPLETIRWHPERLLYVTVPVALLYVLLRAPAAFATDAINVRLLDDVLIHATLFVLGTYAVSRELYTRRIARIERATPELLERLASLNEAGMSVVESIERVRGSDVGAFTPEVERISADVEMGANVEDALVRLGRRIRTTAVVRVVVLLKNAMRASGKLGPVFRIASQQARADLRLHRQRKRQMFTYLVVIYVSFLVFLVIIAAVQEVLVPSLPSNVPTPDAGRLALDPSQFTRFGEVDKAAYTLVFFHATMIQAVLTGFIGGQIGEGSLKDGAKHAAIMAGVAYVVFLVLSAPVATMAIADPILVGDSVTVESASLSSGGFVVLHDGDQNGPVVGTSNYLQPGTHRGESILVGRQPSSGTLVAVAHVDSDGDGQLSLNQSGVDDPYPAPGGGDNVTVSVHVASAP